MSAKSLNPLQNRLAPIATAAGDVSIVVGVFMLGFWMRHTLLAALFRRTLERSGEFRLSASHYLLSGVVMGVVTVMILQAFGAYRRNWGLAHIEELAWIMRSTFMAMVLTLAFSFAVRQLFFSRFVLLFSFPSSSILLAVWHWCSRRISAGLAARSGRLRRAAVYGCGRLAADLSRHLSAGGAVPALLLGFIAPRTTRSERAVEAESPDDLGAWLEAREADLLLIADPSMSRDETADLIYLCEHSGLPYMLVPDVFTLVSHTTRVTSLGGTTLIEAVPSPLRGFRSLLKRLLDVSLSLMAIPFLAPLCLVISAMIVMDDGLPVFYSQTRLGRYNRPFRMFKFRSMRVGAEDEKSVLLAMNEASGPLFKIRRDPRVTRVGRLLRRLSLDELPQILNVLRGEMSLVGPRPPLPEEVETYSERHLKRLQTIPGMTGVWQISGRSRLGFDEMVKLDLYYVDNWSVWLDLSILLLTVPAIFERRGAY